MKLSLIIILIVSFFSSSAQKYDTVKCLVQIYKQGEVKTVRAWAVKSYNKFGMDVRYDSVCKCLKAKDNYLSTYNITEWLEENKFNTLTDLWMPQRTIIQGLSIYYLNEPQFMFYEWFTNLSSSKTIKPQQ